MGGLSQPSSCGPVGMGVPGQGLLRPEDNEGDHTVQRLWGVGVDWRIRP